LSGKTKIKTLVVGCGRMGAGAGGRAQRLTSHAGVLSTMGAFETFVFDNDFRAARRAASALGVDLLEKFDDRSIEGFQCVALCTPTGAHFDQLRMLMKCKIPLIVCEKPVCENVTQVRALAKLWRRFPSRVLVNYSRRFQPAYAKLKKEFARRTESEKLQCCAIRYQRGFLNNASHALDVAQFLTGWDIGEARAQVAHGTRDEFPHDPTATCTGIWNGVLLSVLGLPGVKYSLFEIDFFFERSAVRLRDRGDTVEIAGCSDATGYYAPLVAKRLSRGNLADPLLHLYRHVERMAGDPGMPDNFDPSLALAGWSLKVLTGKQTRGHAGRQIYR